VSIVIDPNHPELRVRSSGVAVARVRGVIGGPWFDGFTIIVSEEALKTPFWATFSRTTRSIARDHSPRTELRSDARVVFFKKLRMKNFHGYANQKDKSSESRRGYL
jgi:hypothetical protein